MNDKIIGIIGGMGPEATAEMFRHIISLTDVTKDQDHFRVVIDSNPKIPDRTKAILNNGKSPVGDIIKTGQNLEKLTPDIMCIPCITSHYFFDKIQQKIKVPILNLLENLNRYIEDKFSNEITIGVLCTSGTKQTKIFDKYLKSKQIVYPTQTIQQMCVMEAIYGEKGIKKGYKSDENKALLVDASNHLMAQGADVIVSGCTEIALVLKNGDVHRPILDPMKIAAHALVNGKY